MSIDARQKQLYSTGRQYGPLNPREGSREDWYKATFSGAFNDGRDVIYDDWGNMIGTKAPDGIRPYQGGTIVIGQDYSKNRLKGDIREQLARTPDLTTAGGAPVKNLPFADESDISITRWMQQNRGPDWGPGNVNLWGNRLTSQTAQPSTQAAQSAALRKQTPIQQQPAPLQQPAYMQSRTMGTGAGTNANLQRSLGKPSTYQMQSQGTNFSPLNLPSRMVNNPAGAAMAAQAAALRGGM